jgi:2'-5' RNA ligase
MAGMQTAPLILTLALDGAGFARLEAERQAHFPPGRNFIPAHLTLFHALPGEEAGAILARLAEAAQATPVLPLRVTGLRPLGRGVAYVVEAEGLARLRAGLAAAFAGWLTPQDRAGWRPHVTVQNKVAPEEARATLALLQARFAPWEARGEGLLLWHYRGGPWEAAGHFPFRGGAETHVVAPR